MHLESYPVSSTHLTRASSPSRSASKQTPDRQCCQNISEFTIMRRTYERGTKARLSFSARSCKHGGYYGRSECRWKKTQALNGMFASLYCAIFRTPSCRKALKFLGASIASLNPETVQLSASYKLSVMFTGACGPPTTTLFIATAELQSSA